MAEPARQLDADALALFARKGFEGGPDVPQAGEANGVKVRRVVQLTADLAPGPFDELRILDLGCGEGVYAIEAGLHGARVLAIDARTERMEAGAAVAERHGMTGVEFRQEDVRALGADSHGTFDVVYCLGVLYHLDVPETFAFLDRVAEVCTGLLVVDTLISPDPVDEATNRGVTYGGLRYREHEDGDPEDVRRAQVLASIDNAWSWRFTRESLVRALRDAGFSSVLEAHAPPEPGKAQDRITLAALRGGRRTISTYPGIRDE
jgi:SAM-dependent methyltransferase